MADRRTSARSADESEERPYLGRSGVVSDTGVRDSQIRQRARVGSLPKTQALPGSMGTVERTQIPLRDEYVSAGGFAWYLNFPRSLPRAIDDLTVDLGDDLYEKMGFDGKIASLTNDFRAGLIEDGLTLHPAIDDEDDPEYQQAEDLAAWCRWALDEMDTGLHDVLWDMSEAVNVGARVAEIVWHLAEDKDGKTALLPKALKVKPRSSVLFVCDAFYNVLGLLGLLPGMATVITPGMLISDLKIIPNFIPREKFLLLTFRGKNADPRGTSISRPAYNAWNLKMQVWPEYLKYLAQFAGPSLWGTPSPDAQPQIADEFGNSLASPLTPEQALLNSLTAIRNGSVIAVPPGTEINAIPVMGQNGEAFERAIDTFNREMAMAILGQTLATEEGKHQTRASTGGHMDIKDSLIRVAKPTVERMLRRDLIRTMIRYNKPNLLHLTPRVVLGKTETRDFAMMAQGVSQLESAGYLGRSQRAGIDQMLGLPARDLDKDEDDALLPPPLPGYAPTQGAQPDQGQGAPKPAATSAPKPAAAAKPTAAQPKPAQRKGAA